MKTKILSKTLLQTDFMQKLSELLGTDAIEALAKETGFISRKSSRLTGREFLEMNLNDFGTTKGDMSLHEKCFYLEEHYNLSMKKQSLDERYNTFAVKFIRRCAELLLQGFCDSFDSIKGIENSFSAIKIVDATSFKLPAAFSVFYQGTEGDGCKSSIKIHQCYELLKGQLLDFHITDGKKADVNYWDDNNLVINKNELHISDLGYYKLAQLQKVAKQEAFFLSRYKTGTNLYIKSETGELKAVTLQELLPKGTAQQVDIAEVYLGKEEPFPVRLVITSVPEEIKDKRLKKIKNQAANRSKKRKSWKVSEEKKLLCGFTIFITNVPATVLSIQQVQDFYALRWQIELLFKIWKSLLAIDKIGKMSIFRFEVYLFSKLILLLLCSQIVAFARDKFANDPDIDIEISEWKSFKCIKKN
jgi:hypothetical protein